MDILCEIEARKQIEQIEKGDHAPMRKTRRLLRLSQRIRSSVAGLESRLELDPDAEAATVLRDQMRALHRLDEDVRVRAIRTLKASRRFKLGFGYGPERPMAWGRRTPKGP